MDINVSAFLRRLKSSTPGCNAAALADLDANMVLTVESEIQVGQEIWDALADKAMDLLVGDLATSLSDALATVPGDFLRYAKLRHGDGVFFLLRSQMEPPLGLLFICDHDTDTEALVIGAKEELEALASTS